MIVRDSVRGLTARAMITDRKAHKSLRRSMLRIYNALLVTSTRHRGAMLHARRKIDRTTHQVDEEGPLKCVAYGDRQFLAA